MTTVSMSAKGPPFQPGTSYQYGAIHHTAGHALYIPGRPKVGYRVCSKPLAKLSHQASGHQALAICHDLQTQSWAPGTSSLQPR
jgi:hypothetical protein